MRPFEIIAAGLLVAAIGTSAHADQCQVVNKDQATWAQKHIKASGKIISWCEKCTPNTKSAPTAATNVKTTPFKGGSDVEIVVNGKSIDLAYTYVQTGADTWANLAFLVGCPASGVQPFTDGKPTK
jgi:hypothetical protein